MKTVILVLLFLFILFASDIFWNNQIILMEQNTQIIRLLGGADTSEYKTKDKVYARLERQSDFFKPEQEK
jgi:hypothetical protein